MMTEGQIDVPEIYSSCAIRILHIILRKKIKKIDFYSIIGDKSIDKFIV